ncbi:hypothetical protein K438DRAFT_1996564 [Mycena galopus ATCC 62051]|nr:hypothetical protein K438DRAFT_1996564 [Mycena galopus ATCC 62051]
MEDDSRADLDHLQSLAEDDDFHAGDLPHFPDFVDVGDILTGAERAEFSHAGGEFASLEEEIEEDWADVHKENSRKREDWRTRRDRTELRNCVFLSQMPEMVSAYIRMCAEPEMPARPRSEQDGTSEEIYEIQVVDMFETSSVEVGLDPQGNGVVPALILAQLIPCAPDRPTVAVKSFVKSLCDLHGVPYRPYLCQQFSIAYDLYLELRRRTDEQVMKALGRDSKWRLRHACPACTYKLEGEDALIFDMLTTMDGNDVEE